MPGRAFILTLGCPKNEADSDEFAGVLVSGGWSVACSAADADLLLLNSCAFLRSAVEESVDTLLGAISWKLERDGRTLILAGCLPGRFGYTLDGELAQVDCVIGPADTDGLRDFLGLPRRYSSCAPSAPASLTNRYLKIAEGCSNNCFYCTIPVIRGPFVPEGRERILDTAAALVDQGASEIGIVAQDTARWTDSDACFTDLVGTLTLRWPDVWWRTYYLHPARFPFELLDLMSNRDNLMPYIDIPVQHFDPRVLAEMGRPYGPEDLLRIARAIDDSEPRVAVRATVIAGYPGEDDRAFELLTGFLGDWVSLRHLVCFPYSPEEGTRQFEKGDAARAGPSVIHDRMMALSSIGDVSQQQWCETLLGEEIEVLLDDDMSGHSRYDAPFVDGSCSFDGAVGRPGQVVRAVVESCSGADMAARLKAD